jgi:hypothetical protein
MFLATSRFKVDFKDTAQWLVFRKLLKKVAVKFVFGPLSIR